VTHCPDYNCALTALLHRICQSLASANPATSTQLIHPIDNSINSEDGQGETLTSRSVRSFVVRNGRITPAQQRALDQLLPVFGVPYKAELANWTEVFGRSAELWVETGFGDGEALLSMAGNHPEINFLGLEVHAPGIGHLLHGVEKAGLNNVRVIRHDAVEVFQQMIAPASIAKALIFFPDPWPKKRHHKRRIVQADFISLLANRLQTGGILHCATDWAPYAESMLELIGSNKDLLNTSEENTYCDRPEYRPLTKFEMRGKRRGHNVFDLIYARNNS